MFDMIAAASGGGAVASTATTAQPDVFTDMLQRLQRLSEQLSGKEAEAATLATHK